MTEIEKWAKEYAESQDCLSEWYRPSLQKGFEAGYTKAIDRAADFIKYFKSSSSSEAMAMSLLFRVIRKGRE
jgi:hypothetical protein